MSNIQPINTVLIKQSHFFATLPDSLLVDMSKKFKIEEWQKNKNLSANILLTHFHILLEGQLEIRRTSPETGREITLDLLKKGDSFDVLTLLDNQPHDVLLYPLTTLNIMTVPIGIMRQWLWHCPELNQRFMPYLARKLREQEDLSSSFILQDVPTRLSRIILKNITCIKRFKGIQAVAHEDHLLTGFSDELLARMIGSVRQVVNRHLQYLKKKGIVDKKRNQLIVRDLKALKDEAKLTDSYF